MKKQVIISDVWYRIEDKDYFIDTWPESCQEIFKQIFKLI